MSIFPLPVFEADADPHHRAAMSDEEVYARLQAPKTVVVRYGYLKFVGEFPYDGSAKPGCGSKLVARTTRGTEIVEMLTTTCSNSGCGKSISRNEMLDYIENSGGRDYPFHQKGRILRVATIDDLNKHSSLDTLKKEAVKFGKAQVVEMKLPMKLVEAEPILGGEQITFFYMSEERIDFRDLVQRLAAQFKTRIEMRQVGARDEARLVADYERCGQHCCCKNFLKVLKPVSMRSAKVQKATLDPLKISGRCGRLMCCLRYEDSTYKELKANLPPRNKRVGTSEGPGVVIDSKILVQLVLVRLEHDLKEIAVPVEELMDPDQCPKPGEVARQRQAEQEALESDPLRGMSAEEVRARTDNNRRSKSRRDKGEKPDRSGGKAPPAADTPARPPKSQQQDAFRRKSKRQERYEKGLEQSKPVPPDSGASPPASGSDRNQSDQDRIGEGQIGDQLGDGKAAQGPAGEAGQPQRKRRRRRRRRRGGGGGGGGGGSSGGDAGEPGGGDSPA